MEWWAELIEQIKKPIEWIAMLNPVDQFLFWLLIVVLFVKLISALAVPVFSWWLTSRDGSNLCKFLGRDSNNAYICNNLFYKNNFKKPVPGTNAMAISLMV